MMIVHIYEEYKYIVKIGTEIMYITYISQIEFIATNREPRLGSSPRRSDPNREVVRGRARGQARGWAGERLHCATLRFGAEEEARSREMTAIDDVLRVVL